MQKNSLTLPSSWRGLFSKTYSEADFQALIEEVDQRYTRETVFPSKENVFRALEHR